MVFAGQREDQGSLPVLPTPSTSPLTGPSYPHIPGTEWALTKDLVMSEGGNDVVTDVVFALALQAAPWVCWCLLSRKEWAPPPLAFTTRNKPWQWAGGESLSQRPSIEVTPAQALPVPANLKPRSHSGGNGGSARGGDLGATREISPASEGTTCNFTVLCGGDQAGSHIQVY